VAHPVFVCATAVSAVVDPFSDRLYIAKEAS
jgi:hypothetical protein